MRAAAIVSLLTLGAAFMPGLVNAQVVTDFVNVSELRERVELWRKARESYYETYYARKLVLEIPSDSRELIVSGYRERKIPAEFAKLEKSVIRAVVHLDLEIVLTRSLTERIRTEYKAMPFFVAGLLDGKVKQLIITIEAVRNALAAEDCRVIPCDPKKCPPDQCAEGAFRRALPAKP